MPYSPERERALIRSHKRLRQKIDAMRARMYRNLDEIEKHFPRQAERMRVSFGEVDKLEHHYFVNLFPEDDSDAIMESKRQYDQGELIDLETFTNGLRGI